jgi:hypothetical protein
MARIRTIKPEFWVSEEVAECSTTARLLFVGLWNFSDDGGNHPASAKRVKMEIFPGDPFTPEQVQDWIDELLKVGLIVEYEGGDGKTYWHITGWHHQRIDKPSMKYPEFSENSTIIRQPFDDHSENVRQPFEDSSPPERKGKESIGKESIGKESIGKESIGDFRRKKISTASEKNSSEEEKPSSPNSRPDEEKEKKVARKKRKAPDNIQARLATTFDDHLQRHFDRKLEWEPKEMGNLKRIRTKIEKAESDRLGRDPTIDEMQESFDHFLQIAAKVNGGWYLENHFTPSGLNSQYQKILNHAKSNGKAAKGGHSLQRANELAKYF